MKNITIRYAAKAEKQFRKLPVTTIKKLQKQLAFLVTGFEHPSLHTKKLQGNTNLWEARIDYHNRFIFSFLDEEIVIIAVGPHDEGLGKK